MKILGRRKLENPFPVEVGDTITLIDGDRGEVLLTSVIDRAFTVDEVTTFSFGDEEIDGMAEGVGGVFGKRKED